MPAKLKSVANQNRPDVRVIIPAFNEQNAVGMVIDEIPQDWVCEIIVVDNASSDGSQEFVRRNYPQVEVLENQMNRGGLVL